MSWNERRGTKAFTLFLILGFIVQLVGAVILYIRSKIAIVRFDGQYHYSYVPIVYLVLAGVGTLIQFAGTGFIAGWNNTTKLLLVILLFSLTNIGVVILPRWVSLIFVAIQTGAMALYAYTYNPDV
ncbi:uncharacterized protein LOC62_04G005845 [Vanrija pseudolonga]|uniref:Uncharacterized protein n=1 Tax=Vanrija pseudolonga TaxID=143232 RepID=A0AAF0YD93_9TREE|nr:hypothetical protein LOC62_04G005845 [Vanrija pseudolonga]